MTSLLFSKITGSGKPVICLHGLLGSAENLGMISRHLATHYEVHSLDARNHGRSFHHPTMNYVAMANDILNYIQFHQFSKVALIGHSMGGKIAMVFALLYPDYVSHLVVLDIAPVTYNPSHHYIFKALNSFTQCEIRDRKTADMQLASFNIEAHERAFLLKNLILNEDKVYKLRINLQAIEKNYANLLAFETQGCFLGASLFIGGSISTYHIDHYTQQLYALFPSATIRMITDAGHWLHAQNPLAVNQLIEGFLTE